MGLDAAAMDALAWSRAFEEMAAVEAGELVNSDEGRQVGHYWLRDPARAPTMGQAQAIGDSEQDIRSFAEDIRSGKIRAPNEQPFTDVLQVGIGGSALGPQLLVDAFQPVAGGLRVHFVDNTDPDGVERILAGLGERLKQTLVVVVSKSGGTVETRNGLDLVSRRMQRMGCQWTQQSVAVTGQGSALDQRAAVEGWLRRFPMWDWIGGRTSVTGAVGLLPGALAGIDMTSFLAGAREMDVWTRSTSWKENPAAMLAGCWHLAGGGRGDRAMVVIPYCDRLVLLSRYLQQLIMESIGKRLDRHGEEVFQGLTVYGNKGSTDQHAYVQQLRDGRDDVFVQFIQVLGDGRGDSEVLRDGANAGDFLQGFLLGTRRALLEDGRPCLTLSVGEVDPHTLGGLVALFERAVGLYAGLVGINAYHQPGVEAGKRAAQDVLGLAERVRVALEEHPVTVDTLAAAFEADPVEVWSILERLVATGRATRDGDRYGEASL
jgi:glucose-6-phosphate isomerase